MPKSLPKKAANKKPKAAPARAAKPAAKPAAKAAPKATPKVAKTKPSKVTKATPKKPAKLVAKKAAPSPASKSTKASKANEPVKKSKKTESKTTSAEKTKTTPPPVGTRPQTRPTGPVKLTPFQKLQKERLLTLRDTILDSMAGVAKDTLRSRPEGSEASAFGMHQADAGSDAYDKDFALSLLSQEQDALYEIEEALKRLENGTYGICEMSGKPIMQARLEALPFARYTVECQAEIERTKRHQRNRTPVTSLFGLTDSESEDDGEEAEEAPPKQQEE